MKLQGFVFCLDIVSIGFLHVLQMLLDLVEGFITDIVLDAAGVLGSGLLVDPK